jgi:hypothetical protein
MEQGTEDPLMIPMYCPHCERRLKINPSAAGQIVNCPGCSKRFRIPAVLDQEEEEERPSTAVRTRPAPSAPARRRPPPPQEPEEEQDFEVVDEPPPRRRPPARQEEEEDEGFEVVEEPEERPKKRRPAATDEEEEERPRKRRRAEEEEDEEEEEEEERPRKKRRKKRRRSSRSGGGELIPGLSNFAAMLIGIVVGWLLLAGVSLAVPPLAMLLSLGGLALAFAGGLWLLIVAFQDDVVKGILCLVVPFYALIYVILNLDTAGRPFLIWMLGNLMMFSAAGILAMSGMH